MYHLRTSIKDLGKKCLGINMIENLEIKKMVIEVCRPAF